MCDHVEMCLKAFLLVFLHLLSSGNEGATKLLVHAWNYVLRTVLVQVGGQRSSCPMSVAAEDGTPHWPVSTLLPVSGHHLLVCHRVVLPVCKVAETTDNLSKGALMCVVCGVKSSLELDSTLSFAVNFLKLTLI